MTGSKDDKQVRKYGLGFRNTVALLVVVVLVISVIFLRYQQNNFGYGEVTIDNDIVVSVDVAASDHTRAKGLSGRESLAMNEGVLFLFANPGKHVFWMKGMYFPIDVIWLRDSEIVDLTLYMEPSAPGEQIPTFAPLVKADAVLEVPAGFAAQHGLKLGLPVEYRIDRRGGLR